MFECCREQKKRETGTKSYLTYFQRKAVKPFKSFCLKKERKARRFKFNLARLIFLLFELFKSFLCLHLFFVYSIELRLVVI